MNEQGFDPREDGGGCHARDREEEAAHIAQKYYAIM